MRSGMLWSEIQSEVFSLPSSSSLARRRILFVRTPHPRPNQPSGQISKPTTELQQTLKPRSRESVRGWNGTGIVSRGLSVQGREESVPDEDGGAWDPSPKWKVISPKIGCSKMPLLQLLLAAMLIAASTAPCAPASPLLASDSSGNRLRAIERAEDDRPGPGTGVSFLRWRARRGDGHEGLWERFENAPMERFLTP